MVTELTDLDRNMMLSIDVVPVPTDEAVREVENRLLGVDTNITNWQRRQNANNNFSAVVPYDMELQRKGKQGVLDDLTTRDQRMMFAVITMVITADDKKQLDSDTETVLSVARKHMCQLAVLKFQQFDGLNTVLPDWYTQNQCVPYTHNGIFGSIYAVQGTGSSGQGRYLFRGKRHFSQSHYVQQGELF